MVKLASALDTTLEQLGEGVTWNTAKSRFQIKK
jgi:hypothetical protein